MSESSKEENKKSKNKVESTSRRVEKELNQQEETKGGGMDIIQSTFNDISNLLQSRSLFPIINITLLLIALVLGRIIFGVIIDNEAERNPPAPPTRISQEEVAKEESKYNPYLLSSFNEGIFLFRDVYASPGSVEAEERYTVYLGRMVSEELLNEITQFKVLSPSGEYSLRRHGTLRVDEDRVILRDTSGCYDNGCYIRVYLHINRSGFETGVYTLQAYSSGDIKRFTSRYISDKEVALTQQNGVNFDIRQVGPNRVRIELASPITTKFFRVELEEYRSDGTITRKHKVFPRDWSGPIELTFSDKPRAMRAYVTETMDIYQNLPVRNYRVVGQYPYMN